MMQAANHLLFSYDQLLKHRARAGDAAAHPIWQAACERLCERLSETTRRFDHLLVLAPWHSGLEAQVRAVSPDARITIHEVSDCFHSAHDSLGLEEARYDCIVSCLSLSAINDLPGVLIQLQRALTPDGLLLTSFLGAHSLQELRSAFATAESVLYGGIHPRVHPFVEVRDAGNLLQRAGFNLPVIDRDMLTLTYAHPLALMHDLRMLGANSALAESTRRFSTRTLFQRVMDSYIRDFSGEDGRIKATLEIITTLGWKPHASQPKPLKRGSATHSLKAALKN